jgi:hypothetical protein
MRGFGRAAGDPIVPPKTVMVSGRPMNSQERVVIDRVKTVEGCRRAVPLARASD